MAGLLAARGARSQTGFYLKRPCQDTPPVLEHMRRCNPGHPKAFLVVDYPSRLLILHLSQSTRPTPQPWVPMPHPHRVSRRQPL